MENEPDLYPDLYHEPTRQQIHFSPRRGWMNDPNGLLCTSEGYNIHFQHNPFGPQHGCANVSWGRAVSGDGVHFKEYPDAIMPYSTRCHVASGSAVLDRYNMSGFGADTIIAAYTALQSIQFQGRPPVHNEGQHLLYSRDGGKTYQYFPWSPIIPVPEGEEWRDPKIVQVDEKTLCILVYETFEGKDCVSFYISHDSPISISFFDCEIIHTDFGNCGFIWQRCIFFLRDYRPYFFRYPQPHPVKCPPHSWN